MNEIGKTNEFNIYLSSFKFGKLKFDESTIMHSFFDFNTTKFTDMREYCEQDFLLYASPLDAIVAEIMEFDTSCEGEEFISKSGNRYSRYLTYSAKINGEDRHSVHWASRGNRNVGDIIVFDGEVIGYMAVLRHINYFVKEGYEELTPYNVWLKGGVSKEEYAVKSLGRQTAVMRDGVKLSSLVYIPKTDTEEKFPCMALLSSRAYVYRCRGIALIPICLLSCNAIEFFLKILPDKEWI